MTAEVEQQHERNLTTARAYLAGIERRDLPEVIATLLHPDIVQEEFPNRLNPRGGRSDRATMLERLERGRALLTAERYEVLNAVASGSSVALEARWEGTLAVALGAALPAGSILKARFAIFFEFRDGLIIAQRNYDCFDPW